MSSFSRFLPLALIALFVFASGCSKKEEAQAPAPPQSSPQVEPLEKKEAKVVVPPEVQGKWQAVKIAVLDRETSLEKIYTVNIGSDFSVADSGVTVQVKNFLPAFIMDGFTMTSVSNETRNPGAQVVISEDGQEIYKGWLFSLYPNTHAFQHPRYGFTLVDFIPAE